MVETCPSVQWLGTNLVHEGVQTKNKLECGPMPNVMAALPNIGGASVQRRKVWLTPTTRAMAHFWRLFGPAFPASHMQHISDMHSKFALRSRHVWKYGRHPIFDR